MLTRQLGFSIRFLLPAITILLWQTPAIKAQTPMGAAPTGVASGERRPEFDQLTVNDGLSQNFVTCILRDHQGFLWFGTRDGLNRYDGYEFKIYSFDAQDTTSLSANAIQGIYEDRHHNLWVGTRFGGLNKYDRATDRFVRYRYKQVNPSPLQLDMPFPMQDDRSGMLWLGTTDGLKRFDPQTGKFASFICKPDDPESWQYNFIYAILEAENGNLWLGTMYSSSGLLYFDRAAETFSHFKVEIWPLTIKAICRDQSGNLWVGDAAGLFRINEQWLLDRLGSPAANKRLGIQEGLVRVADLATAIVWALCRDEEGDIWMGSPDGLFIYDINSRPSAIKLTLENRGVTHILPNLGVTSIYKDRSGIMWLGTNGQGLYKLHSAQQRFGRLTIHPDDPKDSGTNSIRAIYQAGDSTLWIGGYNGLDKLDRQSGSVTHYHRQATGYGGETVWAIYEDPLQAGKILWIGTENGGLYRFDRGGEKFTRYQNVPGDPQSLNDNYVLSLYRDSTGTLWVGTNSGLNRFDDRTGKFTPYNQDSQNPHGLRGTFLLSICESRYMGRRGLWLATINGLFFFDPATEQFTHFVHEPRNPQSLSHNEVLCLKQDRRGRIWVGTGGGLNQLILPAATTVDKNSMENRGNTVGATFVRYTEKNGLPNNVINGILEDEAGHLWLSTNKGLSRFNPDAGTFRNYDVSDGLQSNEFNRAAYYQSRHGEMFFGGINGLNIFFPQALKDNPHLPPVVLTDFKLLNKSVGLSTAGETPLQKVIAETEQIHLSHKDNVFSFEFAALEYTAPEKNQYAYMMEGFDRDWLYVGAKREAVYTNLAPEEYTFRVKAANNDGVWNERGASVKVIIAPPFWRTWWAYTLYVLFIAGLLYGIMRYELNRMRLKDQVQLQHLEAQKLQELDRLKSRFFANISHEFRTPLTLIMGQLESMKAAATEVKLKTRLDMAWRNALQLLRLINQLLDLSKLEAGRMELRAAYGNIVPLLQRLTNSFESLAGLKRIQLRFESASPEIKIYYEPEKIEKIMHNLLSNALKFTPESGKISVQLSVTSNQLSVTSNQLSVISKQSLITDHCLLITVRDSGIGIPQEHLPHVFDRFYQVDSSATREHEGTGIGLALTKELVELHGGEISVASEAGFGTTFVVRLPFSVRSEQVASEQLSVTSDQSSVISERLPDFSNEPPATSIEQPATSIEQLATSNELPATSDQEVILIVEDNADLRSYLREHLEDRFQVWEAGNGAEGLAKAQELVPDLIITDVMMPKMDGYTLSKHLKSDEKTSHIPIIMLTARAEEADKIAGLEIGVDDYLLKPFSPNELRVRVRNLIAIRQRLRERFSRTVALKPSASGATSMDEAFLRKVLAVVEKHFGDENFGVESLGQEVGMSRTQIHRKLKALTNQTASELIRSLRLQRAAELLQHRAGTVAEIAFQVGFGDPSYFTKCFREQFGCLPTEYGKKADEGRRI